MEKTLFFYDGARLTCTWDEEVGSVSFSAPQNTGDVERVRKVWVTASGWGGNALTVQGCEVTLGGRRLMVGVESPDGDALTRCVVVRQMGASSETDELFFGRDGAFNTKDGLQLRVRL